MNPQQQASFSSQVQRCADQLARLGLCALGPLFDLTSPRLVRYALALTRNQHDAEDATQGALVRVAMHPQSLAGARSPWPYLVRMVRNEALMIVRRRRRIRLGSMGELAQPASDPSATADTQRQVWRAIGKLPPEQAEVIILKIWEAMTFAEIARVLGKSPNTVASRYQYALAKLGRYLRVIRHEVLND